MSNTTNNKGHGTKTHTTPPPAVLEHGSDLAEIWLDVVTRSVQGYSAAMWQDADKRAKSMSASVVAMCAVEVADRVLTAYRERVKK